MGRLLNIPKTFFGSGKKIRNELENVETQEPINNERQHQEGNDEENLRQATNAINTTDTTNVKEITLVPKKTFSNDITNNFQGKHGAVATREYNLAKTGVTASFSNEMIDQQGAEGFRKNRMASQKSAQKNVSPPLTLDRQTENEINLQEEIQNLKRSFLYEQNTLIEKCELEKFELRESYEEEKTRLKRAFENERLELIKEIERKDKMLHELARVLKEKYESNLDNYKKDLLVGLEHKAEIVIQLQTKMNCIIANLTKIIENNKCYLKNMEDFQKLKADQDEYTTLSKTLKLTLTSNTKQSYFENNANVINDQSQGLFDENNTVVLTRSFSNPETKRTFTGEESFRTKGRSLLDNNDVDDVQYEMAEEYRKQKADLVKLFNAEKEEERKRLQNDKKNFEKETRIEYESRMTVERKGWQETIEDLEREIKILKYEREQMDRNYCIGMDEMRTEFEKEKQTIYRRYSDQQTKIETKLKKLSHRKSSDTK